MFDWGEKECDVEERGKSNSHRKKKKEFTCLRQTLFLIQFVLLNSAQH